MTDDLMWVRSGYSTEQMREAALALREQMSRIASISGERSERDTVIMQGLEGIAMAAEYIDRIHAIFGPGILAATSEFSSGRLFYMDDEDKVWCLEGGVWKLAQEGDEEYC